MLPRLLFGLGVLDLAAGGWLLARLPPCAPPDLAFVLLGSGFVALLGGAYLRYRHGVWWFVGALLAGILGVLFFAESAPVLPCFYGVI